MTLPQATLLILDAILGKKTLPVLHELGIDVFFPTKKESIFVTLYKNGKLIASQGRIYTNLPPGEEFLLTVQKCTEEKRFLEIQSSLGEINKLQVRVDVLNSEGRKVIQSLEEFQPRNEGLIFFSEPLKKISVLLPQIVIGGKSQEELGSILLQKAGLQQFPEKGSYYLFSLQTQAFTNY